MNDDKLFEDDNEKPRIKVTDRRKFTAAGDFRGDAEEAPQDDAGDAAGAPPAAPASTATGTPEAPATASAPDEASGAASEPAEAPAAASAPAEAPAADAGDDAPGSAAADGNAPMASIADLPRDFTAFVEGMYLEAMLYLGALPDPRTGEVSEDLDMAKYKIDLLGMVQEKTRGNLTDEEDQQLQEVLYQLRMFFVQKRPSANG